jgi:hypothetical protein
LYTGYSFRISSAFTERGYGIVLKEHFFLNFETNAQSKKEIMLLPHWAERYQVIGGFDEILRELLNKRQLIPRKFKTSSD